MTDMSDALFHYTQTNKGCYNRIKPRTGSNFFQSTSPSYAVLILEKKTVIILNV